MEAAYVPVRFLRNLVELVADEERITAKKVIQKTGLDFSLLMRVGGFATFDQSTAVYERVANLSTIPGIGFRSPSARSFADQGMLGALMMLAPTIGEALQKLSKFIDVVGGTVDYKFRKIERLFILSTQDKASYSPAAHRLIAEENLAIWKYTSLPAPGLELHLKEIRLDYPKPRHWRMYTDLFPNCEIRFNRPEIAAVLSADVMDLAIPTHNPEAFRKLESVCEELLSRMTPSFKKSVTEYLEHSSSIGWSASAAADALNMTQKTLSRRLKAEGTSVKEMINARKHNLAMAMMERGLSDRRIAEELGYAGKSSFVRGFKTWTGMTPSQYRKNKPA